MRYLKTYDEFSINENSNENYFKSILDNEQLNIDSEEAINENLWMEIYNTLGGTDIVNVAGESIQKGTATLVMLGSALGFGSLFALEMKIPAWIFDNLKKLASKLLKNSKPKDFDKAVVAIKQLSKEEQLKLAKELAAGMKKEN